MEIKKHIKFNHNINETIENSCGIEAYEVEAITEKLFEPVVKIAKYEIDGPVSKEIETFYDMFVDGIEKEATQKALVVLISTVFSLGLEKVFSDNGLKIETK